MRPALRWAFLAVSLALLAWAVWTEWDEVTESLQTLSWPLVIGAAALCVVGVGCSLMSWRAVMTAIGLEVQVRESMRVFGVSQIGKYIPGSVWPVLAQAEFAREHGVSRARAFTGSLVSMAVGAITAGVVGGVGLVLAVPGALATYWWVLAAAAGLAVMLVPSVLARAVHVVFRVTRRTEDPVRIGARPLLVSAAWSLGMWVALGLHAYLLLTRIAPGAGLLLATGAFALSWLAGFLVVIAPAGAGAREGALVLTLATVATPTQALSLALVSRFLMTIADLVALGAALALGGRGPTKGAVAGSDPVV